MKKISKADKNSILEKHEKLNTVKGQLKSEFVGLDDVIDEICNLVEPWCLFPGAQMRPTVINLWGPTGTGKTSLVIRLFQLLEMSSVLKFDTGEWVDKSDFQLTNKISGQVRKITKDNMIPIFIFDEFQLGRTKDDVGDDIDRPQLRVIWDLLDSGKFDILEEKWEVTSIIKLYTKLSYLITDKKVVVKDGRVTKNKDAWDIIFLEDADEEDLSEKDVELLTKYYTKDAFIPVNKIWNIKSLGEEKFFSEIQVCDYLKTLDGDGILKFLEDLVENASKPVEHDFSDSIIFIIGNLDSAYYGSSEMSPDMDADSLYEHTQKITLSDIKNSLTLLYRPEQISRLGNNHVIYKSFNEQMYKDLIQLELNKIVVKIKNKFEFDINFDESINDLIYKEGVFPTQGVRPVFSTITSLIESYVGRIIVDCLKQKIDIVSIDWKYENEKYTIIVKTDKKDKAFEYPVLLKVDNLRKSKSDDLQALVGIHEAGHVLSAVYGLNICPKSVVSKTANDEGGFTHIETPEWETKELILKDISCLLGGYCAERLVFGDENKTNGCISDLERSTKLALRLVKEWGMNGTPVQFSTPDFRISGSAVCLNDDELDKMAVEIITSCKEKCEKILKDNMELLLRMGKYLTDNSKMDADEIKKMVEEYGIYDVPEYKTKDNYYKFKSLLEERLKEYETSVFLDSSDKNINKYLKKI